MNVLNLPIFILLFAIAYLSIVYGLLSIVQAQKQSLRKLANNSPDIERQIKTP